MREKYYPLLIALCLIAIGVLMRILPHPANFAPITAIALFGGSVLPKKVSIWVPLGAMMISDTIIGYYALMPLIWLCYLAIAFASSRLLRPANLWRGAAVTIGSSIFFYLVTNFGVWATSGMYTHTWSGLVQCYVLAIPFFRNTLLSDTLYTAALFGVFALTTNEYAHNKFVTKFINEKIAH